MTNAIEQAKREMYDLVAEVKNVIARGDTPSFTFLRMESAIESYLELLRQDHEALHETARARFEDIGKLESENQELIQRLAKMTEERDSIQLRLHAVDHAYNDHQSKGATMHQDSGDRVSCAAPGSNVRVIIEAIDQCKWEIEMWGMKEIRARKAIRTIAKTLNDNPELNRAINELAPNCMHSFFEISDDQMKCTFCGVGK